MHGDELGLLIGWYLSLNTWVQAVLPMLIVAAVLILVSMAGELWLTRHEAPLFGSEDNRPEWKREEQDRQVFEALQQIQWPSRPGPKGFRPLSDHEKQQRLAQLAEQEPRPRFVFGPSDRDGGRLA